MSKQSEIVHFCREYPVFACLLLLTGVPTSIYVGAATTQHLWHLFVVPLGMMEIGLLHAWALKMLARYLVPSRTKWLVDKPESDKSSAEHFADALHFTWSNIIGCLLILTVVHVAVAWFGPVVP